VAAVTRWARFAGASGAGFGTVDGDVLTVHRGDMFSGSEPTGERLALDSLELLVPCAPTKIIGLWNNFRAAATKQGLGMPVEPLYFIKPPSSLLAHGGTVVRPRSYRGRILFEGELGIVIGRTCVDVEVEGVDDVVFGYTCVNDVTALDLIEQDPSFAQWTRAKGFDTFAVIGPVIATGLDPGTLRVTTSAAGRTRQDYPVSDMILSPHEIVSLVSRDVTLVAGDVIACGTSLGAMPMRPGTPIDVAVEGIGVLTSTLGAELAVDGRPGSG